MTPWVFRLLLANLGTYLLIPMGSVLWGSMVLLPAAIVLRPWTVVTYMFLHAGMGHLFFNMLTLFFFGPRLEAYLGSRDFLRLYFLSGFGGAALSFLFSPMTPIVGASGAIYGVLIAFAMIWPRERIYIWGVLPIEARLLAAIAVGLSVFGGFGGTQGNIAHFAHLGGLVAGYLFLRYRKRRMMRPVPPPPGATVRSAPPPPPRPTAEVERLRRWRAISLDGLHAINREEVVSLLRKLERHGPAALTADERDFLDRMAM